MMEEFARRYPMVFFASMHPGWCDTPGMFNELLAKWFDFKPFLSMSRKVYLPMRSTLSF
jgi:hypothetical protein